MFFSPTIFWYSTFSCSIRNIVTSDFETFSCEKTWFNKVFIFFPGDAAQLGGLKGTSLHLHLHLHSYTYTYTTLVHIHLHLHTQCTFSFTLTVIHLHSQCTIIAQFLQSQHINTNHDHKEYMSSWSGNAMPALLSSSIRKASAREFGCFFDFFQTGGSFSIQMIIVFLVCFWVFLEKVKTFIRICGRMLS